MYSTCLFCKRPLGKNEAIEEFPVGRRLAFDVGKGRLWVVCHQCERWNLTPIEERWEAIESCERAFRATRLRTSTDEIGLAKLREGTELVRIGAPQRPEMAAWRYGDQFGRRTRRNVLEFVGVVGAGAAVMWGGPALGLYAGGVVGGLNLAMQGAVQWSIRRRPVARLRVTDAGQSVLLRLAHIHVARTTLRTEPDGGWSLDVHSIGNGEQLVYTKNGLRHLTESRNLTGADARRALGLILPHLNTMVARRRTVDDAVRVLDDAGSPEQAMRQAACLPPTKRWNGQVPAQGNLGALPVAVRLALEMATHEETERRALEGELHVLEEAWRDAEEIAAIADNLLVPTAVEAALLRIKRQASQS